jgi:hypothetical protein
MTKCYELDFREDGKDEYKVQTSVKHSQITFICLVYVSKIKAFIRLYMTLIFVVGVKPVHL